MKHLLFLIVLAALLVAPVAAEDNSSGGILEAIIDFFTWWIPESEPAETVTTLSEGEGTEIPGTNITAAPTVEPTTTPGENVTVATRPDAENPRHRLRGQLQDLSALRLGTVHGQVHGRERE